MLTLEQKEHKSNTQYKAQQLPVRTYISYRMKYKHT